MVPKNLNALTTSKTNSAAYCIELHTSRTQGFMGFCIILTKFFWARSLTNNLDILTFPASFCF